MPTTQSTLKKPIIKRDNSDHVIPVSPPKKRVLKEQQVRLERLFTDNDLWKSVQGKTMRICGGKYAGKQGIVENRLGFVILFRSLTNANEIFSVHKTQYAKYYRVSTK